MAHDKVGGIERFPIFRDGLMESDARFRHCPFCGSEAGFRKDRQNDYRAECSNTSCGVATPYHYKTVESALYAWNRKPGDPPCLPADGERQP